MKEENGLQEIHDALVGAIALVEECDPKIPADLRGVALVEVFRALRGHVPTVGKPGAEESGRARSAHVGPQELPEESVVATRGDRRQRIVFAALQLEARGDSATAAAISQYSKEELASELKKVSDVLKEGTPLFWQRKKVEGVFVYTPSKRGLEHLKQLLLGVE